MVRIRRNLEPACGLDPQAMLFHQSPDAVLAHPGALTAQFMSDAAGTVGLVTVVKGRLDIDQQRLILTLSLGRLGLEVSVIPAPRHSKDAAHLLHSVLGAVL